MEGRITASIVIYKNDLRLLQNAVQSFLDSTENSFLYLIDNSPTNDYCRYFQHPRIEYTFNNKNIGFGRGHNLALKKILESGQSTYHVVLNPDVYFEKEVMSKIFHFMERHSHIGLV